MARLVLDQVQKSFQGEKVINSLSLNIEAGAFVALLGPSGCGKSTILRMLAGFENVSAGEIRHGDQCLSNVEVHVSTEARPFGMVFQSYALWPHMTVEENIGYPLKVQKINNKERVKRIAEALDIVQLNDYAKRLPAQLSGGQRQRVALARSLVTEPDVILFDEPLANLDKHLRSSMEETFRAFHQRTGATMVYVTHDQAEAMSLADQVAVLKQGELVQWGTPQEIYNNPKTAWLANFIGRGSVLNITEVPPSKYIYQDELHERLQGSDRGGVTSHVLVRPQDITFSDSSMFGLPVVVKQCIYRGERYDIELLLSNGQALLAYSDVPLMQGSSHFVVLHQAWSLESKS